MVKEGRPNTILDDYMEEVKGHMVASGYPGDPDEYLHLPLVQKALVSALAEGVSAAHFVALVKFSVILNAVEKKLRG